jgi:fumarate hydratase class II
MVEVSGALNVLAVSLMKIANDIRLLGSGPRCGLGELMLPENEPGSSIMPGKVNPTQAEAMLMVTIQILGNDMTIAMAGKEGNFELNAFRPVIIANLLHSMRILADMCRNLRTFMIEGAQLNTAKITEHVDRSVMMVTALAPVIGYDKASAIAHTAIDEDLTLKQAALKCGVSEELFDRVVVPIDLTEPGSADQS